MLTLEDANAILAEFDRSSPICDEDVLKFSFSRDISEKQ